MTPAATPEYSEQACYETVLAQLADQPTRFDEITRRLSQYNHDQIVRQLRRLHAEGKAEINYGFGWRLTEAQVAASAPKPRIEVVILRDSDSSTEVATFVDGVRQDDAIEIYEVDNGGPDLSDPETLREWVHDRREDVENASPAAAAYYLELVNTEAESHGYGPFPDHPDMTRERLAELRAALEAEEISYGEMAEIDAAFDQIDPDTLPEPPENAMAEDRLDEIEARLPQKED